MHAWSSDLARTRCGAFCARAFPDEVETGGPFGTRPTKKQRVVERFEEARMTLKAFPDQAGRGKLVMVSVS
ncbi:hypothetical protein RHIZ404_190222 [Rhizobium sp. EC-SD404]|nr:hypothetical protein RHIZ404_190222 [Rhizobium sp. EC-SD404]